MRGAKRLPIYFDNEVDITDELDQSIIDDRSRRQRKFSVPATMISNGPDQTKEIDITDMNASGINTTKSLPRRKFSLPVSKVYIKAKPRKTSSVSFHGMYNSLTTLEASESESSTSSDTNSIRSSPSSPDLSGSRPNIFALITRNDSMVGSLADPSEYGDCDSIWESNEKSKFHVKFYNRYGRKGKDDEELQNATSVSHVYKDVTLVTDMINNKVLLYGQSGRPRKSFVAEDGSEPWAAVVTPRGYVAVTLRRKQYVALWSASGEEITQFGHEQLKCPTGIAVDKRGRFFVTDEELGDVFIFSPSGHCVGNLGGGFKQPRFVCVSCSCKILVSDSGNHCVKVFDDNGKFLYKFGKYGSGNGQMKFPYGVCTDQDENVFVADHYNDRVSVFTIDGTFVQHLVTCCKGLKRPRGISIRCTHDRKLFVTNGVLKASEVAVYKLISMDSQYEIQLKCEL